MNKKTGKARMALYSKGLAPFEKTIFVKINANPHIKAVSNAAMKPSIIISFSSFLIFDLQLRYKIK